MRICLLTSTHKPNDPRIFFKEARSLSKRYRDVWIVSPYASHIPADNDGIRFLPINTHPERWGKRLKTMQELFEAASSLRADVYHCHEPESLITAVRLKKVLGCKVVFDSHEMYSATLAQRFPKVLQAPVMKVYQRFEKTKVKKCDFVIGATQSISRYLAQTAGPDRTETILNGAMPDILGPARSNHWGEETVICHNGSLEFARGLKCIIEAIRKVAAKHAVKFRIVGDVFGRDRQWLDSYIKKHGMEDIVQRTGWLEYLKIGPAISGCHIGLIAFDKLPNHVIAAPNKLFNYMHFGMPVVAPDHCTDISRLIEDEQCGLVVRGNSASSYADALNYLVENRNRALEMGLNARKASDTKYSWPIMEKKLFEIYRQLGNSGHPSIRYGTRGTSGMVIKKFTNSEV
ncbi:MAG: glycosyltransferase family 4 protein [Nitrospiraceae bacterium]|nr:glycosyltransferase family 4 protein [Nitrospiraceae bacterium]